MSFPISPSNNQIALVNGIEYYYLATKGAWYRYGDGSANVITSNTFQVLSSLIFSDGTSQTTAANPTDAFARTTANTATDNITLLQGVNTTQNTNITILEGVDVGQNTRMGIIEGVDTTQNTNITIATDAATAAFARANAAYELANTANTTASSGGGGGASISTSSYNYRKYQGDGSTVAFTISSGHTANTVLVFNNGVCQMPFDDYTVSATTLTYVIAPQSDETIQIRELPVA